MNKIAFGDAERHVLSLFSEGSTFAINDGSEYAVILSGKPKTRERGGECKTDVYVLIENSFSKERMELKITFKKENADFLENKMTAERAMQIMGSDWKIQTSGFLRQIEKSFLNRALIYRNSFGRTQAGSFTLGWKMEFVNRANGELSGNAQLSHEQVVEIYSGNNLAPTKRDAIVMGRIIPGSGSANVILSADVTRIHNISDAITSLELIDTYVKKYPEVFFVCKALNYRSFENKYDGNRPLAVYVNWDINNGLLSPTIRFDQPLLVGGDAVAIKLKESLRSLQIRTANDINLNNINNINIVH